MYLQDLPQYFSKSQLSIHTLQLIKIKHFSSLQLTSNHLFYKTIIIKIINDLVFLKKF